MPLAEKKKKKEFGCSGDSKRNFPRANSPTHAKATVHGMVTSPGRG